MNRRHTIVLMMLLRLSLAEAAIAGGTVPRKGSDVGTFGVPGAGQRRQSQRGHPGASGELEVDGQANPAPATTAKSFEAGSPSSV